MSKESERKEDELTPEDRALINGNWLTSPEESEALFVAMRTKYAGISNAQEEIDFMDPRSRLRQEFQNLKQAMQSGDEAEANRLMMWYEENYPFLNRNSG